MAVEILMPELGESVHEGTVSRWLKQEGDFVKEDEPVVEIMTDKVNTELPAPASGILSKILVKEGDAVEVYHAMGIIESQAAPDGSGSAAPPVAEREPDAAPGQRRDEIRASQPSPATDAIDKRWFTPVVRAIAKEQGLSEADLAAIAGSGDGGRVTKKDVEAYLFSRERLQAPAPVATPLPPSEPAKEAAEYQPKPTGPAVAPGDQRVSPLTGLRKMIAEAMVRSAQIPTVSTVTQVDVTAMVKFREQNKESFAQTYGVKLTYTPFFIKALAETLSEFPIANSTLTADNKIVTPGGVHIGIAVALGQKGDEGLIVPVIRDCHRKTLIDIAKDLEAIAKAARSQTLKPADVQGGTFTLTNPGTYGALFGTPMINAPQAGILGTYSIQKTPVIIDDMIAIRSIMHLVLTYDHRIIDGLVAGKLLAAIRDRLQKFDFFR